MRPTRRNDVLKNDFAPHSDPAPDSVPVRQSELRRAINRRWFLEQCGVGLGSVALGSLSSGLVYNAWGWAMLNWIILPVTGICLAALVMLRLTRKPAVTAR